MLEHPGIDPVALALGPIKIHWYGLMYLFGFMFGLWYGKQRAKKEPWRGWNPDQVDDLLFYVVMGILVGGRLGSVFFYNMELFLANPLYLFKVWEGGMSFHGGLIGVVTGMFLFARKYKKSVFEVGDFVGPLVPAGIGLGRIGNFINQELWGHPTDVPWAMLFPLDPDQQYRHPSMLYEFLLEGVLLLIILYFFSRKPKPRMVVGGMFLFLYGCFRTFVEFFRMPVEHIGYLAADFITMGMVLSMPMVLAGLTMIVVGYKQKKFDVYPVENEKAKST